MKTFLIFALFSLLQLVAEGASGVGTDVGRPDVAAGSAARARVARFAVAGRPHAGVRSVQAQFRRELLAEVGLMAWPVPGKFSALYWWERNLSARQRAEGRTPEVRAEWLRYLKAAKGAGL